VSLTAPATGAADEVMRCARHPGIETVLRCGRCETPICPKCMVETPVGARCPTCARVKRFAIVVKPVELLRAAVLGVLVGAIGTVVVAFIPFLGLLGYALLGFVVGEAVSVGANRKRARELGPLAIACLVVGFELGVAAAAMIRFGVPFGPQLFGLPNGLGLLGLGVGALLAWMRVR
jgi:hypothetical protein